MACLKPIKTLEIGGVVIQEGKRYNILWKSDSGGYKKENGKVSQILWEENCILFDTSKEYQSRLDKIYLNEEYGIFEIEEIRI